MEKIIQLNFKWGIVQQTMAMIAGRVYRYLVDLHRIGFKVTCDRKHC